MVTGGLIRVLRPLADINFEIGPAGFCNWVFNAPLLEAAFSTLSRRIVASLDRKRLWQGVGVERRSRSEAFSISKDFSLRSMLASREFRFLSYVLSSIAPYLGCSENLAQSSLRVVNSFRR